MKHANEGKVVFDAKQIVFKKNEENNYVQTTKNNNMVETVKIRFTSMSEFFGEEDVTISGLVRKICKRFGDGMFLLKYKDNFENKCYIKRLQIEKLNESIISTLDGEHLFNYNRDLECGNIELIGICKIEE